MKGRTIRLDRLAAIMSQARGLTSVREWVKGSDIAPSTWSRVEAQKTEPTLSNFVKICNWLGIDPATVLSTIVDG